MDFNRFQRLFDGSVTFPVQRDELRRTEKKKDEEAYDALSQKIEEAKPIPEGYQGRWRRTYRKMREHRDELKHNGSVHLKYPESDVYVVKFRRDRNGTRVQSSIHIVPADVANLAVMVLTVWRDGGELADLTGKPPKSDPDDILKQAG